jgi:hypothetical protein
MKERTIVPGPYAFANGSQYETWVARNCARCSKYDPETMSESRCAIDHALVIAYRCQANTSRCCCDQIYL